MFPLIFEGCIEKNGESRKLLKKNPLSWTCRSQINF